jgi:hypothetical protein
MSYPAEGIGPRTREVGYAVTNAGETTQLAIDTLQGVEKSGESNARFVTRVSHCACLIRLIGAARVQADDLNNVCRSDTALRWAGERDGAI